MLRDNVWKQKSSSAASVYFWPVYSLPSSVVTFTAYPQPAVHKRLISTATVLCHMISFKTCGHDKPHQRRQRHLVNVCRCFPHWEQEWCASWRLCAIKGIRQKPKNNLQKIEQKTKHEETEMTLKCQSVSASHPPKNIMRTQMHQASFPGWYVTWVAPTWSQYGQWATPGTSCRDVSVMVADCDWFTDTGWVCTLLTPTEIQSEESRWFYLLSFLSDHHAFCRSV